jgi:GT2 family glycosyltransferase
MQRVSIIIVTYNGLHGATKPCMESIFSETDYSDFEVVVVDNNSTDGTPLYLEELACREPRLKVLLNTINRGFAGGNNDALQIAQGDIIVLLNNDTLVTSGWLTRIVYTLTDDSSVGMVGPVTNSSGNEQNIFISATSTEDIILEGIRWKDNGAGDSFLTEKLCFFCVAFRRKLLEEVGMLDEKFGLGFYEDDDYCIRVKKAGYYLKCLEDVFVFHQGSASFNSFPGKTKELLRRNKRLLESKHGITYFQAHPRDCQLNLIDSYLDRLETSGFDEGVWYRVVKRFSLAKTLQPKGILKKLRFFRRVRRLQNRARIFDPQKEML